MPKIHTDTIIHEQNTQHLRDQLDKRTGTVVDTNDYIIERERRTTRPPPTPYEINRKWNTRKS